MPSHNYTDKIDALIVNRGCDPRPAGAYVYRLSDEGIGAGPYISEWSPPDASYGDQPTEAEIDAVSDAAAEAEASSARHEKAQSRLDADALAVAMLDAIASATSIDADALKEDVVTRLQES
jgi:hypothetical protein